jgi:hypothetical protein
MPWEYHCGTCWRDFPAGFRAREQHCEALGHLPPEFECDTCPGFFRNERQLTRHMNYRNHWVTPPNSAGDGEPNDGTGPSCAVCWKQFTSEAGRDRHCYDTGHLKFSCPVCRERFATSAAQAQHCKATGHIIVFCSVCGNVYFSENARDQHFRAKHQVHQPQSPPESNKPQHQCRSCASVFETNFELRSHKAISHHWDLPDDQCYPQQNSLSSRYWCVVCGSYFASKGSRDTHCITTGCDPPEFECETCPRDFPNAKRLHKHMDATSHWMFDNKSSAKDSNRLEHLLEEAKRLQQRNEPGKPLGQLSGVLPTTLSSAKQSLEHVKTPEQRQESPPKINISNKQPNSVRPTQQSSKNAVSSSTATQTAVPPPRRSMISTLTQTELMGEMILSEKPKSAPTTHDIGTSTPLKQYFEKATQTEPSEEAKLSDEPSVVLSLSSTSTQTEHIKEVVLTENPSEVPETPDTEYSALHVQYFEKTTQTKTIEETETCMIGDVAPPAQRIDKTTVFKLLTKLTEVVVTSITALGPPLADDPAVTTADRKDNISKKQNAGHQAVVCKSSHCGNGTDLVTKGGGGD